MDDDNEFPEHIHMVLTCRRCGGDDVDVFETLHDFEVGLEKMVEVVKTHETTPIITARSKYYLAFSKTGESGVVHPYFVTYRYCSDNSIVACTAKVEEHKTARKARGVIMSMDVDTGEVKMIPINSLKDLEELPEDMRAQILEQHPELALVPDAPDSESLPPDPDRDEMFRKLMK